MAVRQPRYSKEEEFAKRGDEIYSLPSVELDIKQRNTDESNRAAKWQKV